MTRRAALAMLTASSCSQKPEGEGRVDHYRLEGVIVALRPEARIATIKHEPIKDEHGKVWMEAMTMDFPVKAPEEFGLLRVGMKIEARLSQRVSDYEYWLDRVVVR
jgi:Cu/Ag efflux protein CusF